MTHPEDERIPTRRNEAIESLYGTILDITAPTGALPNLTGDNLTQSLGDAYLTEVVPELDDAWLAVANACIRYGAPRAYIMDKSPDMGTSFYSGIYTPMSTGLLAVGNLEPISEGQQYGQTVVGMVRAYLVAGKGLHWIEGKLKGHESNQYNQDRLTELQGICDQDPNPSPAKIERVVRILRNFNNGTMGDAYYKIVVEALAGAQNARSLAGQSNVSMSLETPVRGYRWNKGPFKYLQTDMHRLTRRKQNDATYRAFEERIETRLAVCEVPVFVDPEQGDPFRVNKAVLPDYWEYKRYRPKGETPEELQAEYNEVLTVPRRHATNARAIAALLRPDHLTPLKDIDLGVAPRD